MRTREEIEDEFFGDGDTVEKYRNVYNHDPIYPSDKEQHFMEVLLDIRDLLANPPVEITGVPLTPPDRDE
jgi:hypothetical protein